MPKASDLARALSAATDLPLWKAEKGVAAVFREIVLLTNSGDEVRVPHFGVFRLVLMRQRTLASHLPHLGGKLVTVPARRRLVFQPTSVRNRRRVE